MTPSDSAEIERYRRTIDELQDLIDIAPAFFGHVAPTGEVLGLNELAVRVIGATKDDIIGKVFWEAPWWKPLPASAARIRRAVEEAAAGQESQFDVLYWALAEGGGEARWVATSVAPRVDADGVTRRIAITGIDVTERKRAEQAVQESEDRYRGAIEAANLGTWSYDPATGALHWSKRCAELFGLSESEHTTLDTALSRVHPQDRERVEQAIAAALDPSGSGTYAIDYRVVPDGGEVRWLSLLGQAKFEETPAGRVAKWFSGTALDVTERFVVQTALRIAKEEAEEANKLKSAFLANMSHEIRTPLGAILGYAELIKEGRSPEESAELLDIIIRNGRALTHIIDDILDLSKVEAGQVVIERVEVSLAELVEDVTTLLREAARKNDVELGFHFHPNAPRWIKSDPTRLRQILVNVVGNAVKFAPGGSVEIEVRPTVDGIEVLVRDTGIGLTPDQRTRIFEPFVQADSSTTRAFGGSGLGLALSRRLARAMGGDVAVRQSAPGRGSTFAITIAAERIERAAPPPKRQERPDNAALSSQGSHAPAVLLVEDAPDNQKLVQLVLSKAGMKVTLASDGAEGVSKAREKAYDVILMDMQMPVMDGFAATRTLRGEGYVRPIVALTAHAMAEDGIKIREAGCDAHLTKPLDFKLLVRTIQELSAIH